MLSDSLPDEWCGRDEAGDGAVEGTRSALVVASDDYTDPGLRRLRAPAVDAQALTAVLHDPAIGGFEVRTLLNEPAHVVNLAVEEFFADRATDDLLLLHFSCHGVKDEDGELYFAAANTVLRALGATAVPAEFVNRRMSRSRSRRVVLLLDCCYAGAFERGMTARAGAGVGIESQFGGRGRAVITASSAMEYAFEGSELTDSQELQPSVFTSALVEGLETGEADRDQDGMVALDELYDYIYDKVRATTPNQTPGKWTFGVQGDLYIARRAQPVTTPAPIPPKLQEAIDSPFAAVRGAAVQELARLLQGRHAGLALAARQTLERMAGDPSRSLAPDDSRTVAAAAAAVLGRETPPQPKPKPDELEEAEREAQEREAREKAEREKAEREKAEREKAEQEKAEREAAEREAREDVENGWFDAAIEKLDQILRVNPQNSDARDLMAVAQRQKELQDLYDIATAEEASKNWRSAAKRYSQILRIESGYKDAEQRRAFCESRIPVGRRERLGAALVFAAIASVVLALFLPWQVDTYSDSGRVVKTTLVTLTQTSWEFGRVGPTLLLAVAAALTIRWRPVAGGVMCAVAFIMGWQVAWQSIESRNDANRTSDLKLGFFLYAVGALMLVVAAVVAVTVLGPAQPYVTLRTKLIPLAIVLVLGATALHIVQFDQLPGRSDLTRRVDYWQMASVVAISIMVLAAGRHLIRYRMFLLSAFAALGVGTLLISTCMVLYLENGATPFRLYAADVQIAAAIAVCLVYVRPAHS